MINLQKGVNDIREDIGDVRRSITQFNQAVQKLVPAGTSDPSGSLLDALHDQYCKNTALHGQQILSVIQSQERESAETRQQLQLLVSENNLYSLSKTKKGLLISKDNRSPANTFRSSTCVDKSNENGPKEKFA